MTAPAIQQLADELRARRAVSTSPISALFSTVDVEAGVDGAHAPAQANAITIAADARTPVDWP